MSSDRMSTNRDTATCWADHMWMGDPDGDITLEFEGWAWKVKADILGAHFPWMNSAFPNSVPVSIVRVPLSCHQLRDCRAAMSSSRAFLEALNRRPLLRF